MPDLTALEFAAIEWQNLSSDDYDEYMDTGKNGKTLSTAQKTQAKRVHEWVRNDLTTVKGVPADNLFGGEGSVVKWSIEYWFLYFWKEAAQSVNRPDAVDVGFSAFGANTPDANLLFIFNRYFKKPSQPFRHLESRVPLATCDISGVRAALLILLQIGFRPVPIEVQTGQMESAAGSWKRYCIEGDKTSLKIAWRSEDRTIKDVQKKGGYEPQAWDESWAAITNMSADWHPFSHPSTKGKLWYRLYQNDNCKYTVTSVAKEVRVSLGFPKLDKDNYPNLPLQKLSALSEMQRNAITKDGKPLVGQVTLGGGGKTETRWLLVTRVDVAQVLLEDAIFDTQQAQDAYQVGSGFREMGVGKIPLRNVVGWYSFYRVHHGITEPEGFTAVIKVSECQQPKLKHLLRYTADATSAQKLLDGLRGEFTKTCALPAIASAWGPTGYAEPTVKLTLADNVTPATIREILLNNTKVWP